MCEELKPVRCGCGGEAEVYGWFDGNTRGCMQYFVFCSECDIHTRNYDEREEAIQAWNRAMGERTAKATCKPEAFFYRCECGYGLCCEKNDMNYCPSCGAKLEWK